MSDRTAGERRDTARARRRAHVVPQRNPRLTHLSLRRLRAYREVLSTEERRVTYWRRLVQARLDLVRAVQRGVPAVDHLRDVLASAPMRSDRTALLGVVPTEDLPPLPELGALWNREPATAEPEEIAALEDALDDAERRLSAYRTVLHSRIDAATAELIARYREDPGACLAALPRQRGARHVRSDDRLS